MNKGLKIMVFITSLSLLSSVFGFFLPQFDAQEVTPECAPIDKTSIENFPEMYQKYDNFCLSKYPIDSKFLISNNKFIVKQQTNRIVIANLTERQEWIANGKTTVAAFKRTIRNDRISAKLPIPLRRNSYTATGIKPVQKILGYIYKIENNEVYVINADVKVKVCRKAKNIDVTSMKSAAAFCLGRRIDYSVKSGEQLPAGIGYSSTLRNTTTPTVTVTCTDMTLDCTINVEGDPTNYRYGDPLGSGYVSGFYIASRASAANSLKTRLATTSIDTTAEVVEDSAIISVVQNTPPCAEYNFNYSIGGEVDTKTCAALNPSNSANWIYFDTAEGKTRLNDTTRTEDFKLYVPMDANNFYEKVDYKHTDPNTGQWENSVIWDGRKFVNETGSLCTNLYPSWNYDMSDPVTSIPPEERACTSSESAGAYRIYEPELGLFKRYYTYIFIGEETINEKNYLVFVIFKDRTSNT